MIRPVSFLVSYWLALLFVCGHGARMPWLLDDAIGLGALFALFGAIISPMVSRRTRIIGPIALSLGLFAICYVGLVLPTPPWMPFCVGLAAVALLGTRIATLLWSPRDRGTMAPADS